MKKYLIVAETFYSLQGEGPTAGIPAIFLRLGGCNLLCGRNPNDTPADGATWECDTIDVWRKGKRIEVNALLEKMNDELDLVNRVSNGAHLVVTGGEPLMQQDSLAEFLELLSAEVCHPIYVEIETNGTMSPECNLLPHVNQYNVSPKLRNSGQPFEKRVIPEALEWFVNNSRGLEDYAFFKFVVSDAVADWDEIKTVFVEPFDIPLSSIVLMPAASTLEELRQALPTLADLCKSQGVRMSSRAQIEIWNQTTGV